MTGLRGMRVFLAAMIPAVAAANGDDEQYLEIGRICVEAREPDACMTSYGFECDRGRSPCESRQAERLGCNLDLGDGRAHFVQMFYDGSSWALDGEHTYELEYEEARLPEENTDLALSDYLRLEMNDYNVFGSGSSAGDSGEHLRFEVGVRRQNGRLDVRALCGATNAGSLEETSMTDVKSRCERRLQHTIRSLSQPQAPGPYRVAGASEIEWQSRSVTLVSADSALIVEGRYRFAAGHRPCRYIDNCCSEDGILYLQSCRTPTESELQAIDDCLASGHRRRSGEFTRCLRDAGVKVGCESQDDGSYLCY